MSKIAKSKLIRLGSAKRLTKFYGNSVPNLSPCMRKGAVKQIVFWE